MRSENFMKMMRLYIMEDHFVGCLDLMKIGALREQKGLFNELMVRKQFMRRRESPLKGGKLFICIVVILMEHGLKGCSEKKQLALRGGKMDK